MINREDMLELTRRMTPGADFVCADGGLLYGFGWGV